MAQLKRAEQLRDAELLVTKTVTLDRGDPEAKRREILDYFHKTFSLYESLFECLASDEAFYVRANPLRHPLIFYYGHTAVFFINKLNVAGLIKQRVDPALESMLAVGVDEMSWDDLNEKRYDWPTPAQVKAYRDATRAIVDSFIRTCPLQLPITWDDPLWIVLMGIEHERIHLETSSVLMRELPLEHLWRHPLWSGVCESAGKAPANELLRVGATSVTIGKTREDRLYGWDNEYGVSHEDVAPFAASKFLVSNGEFLRFVEAGGYQNRDYWTAEGWSWRCYANAVHPRFWVKDGAGFHYRTMLDLIDMPWNWPVDVNQLEAKAFCNWLARETGKSIRLPSEAEWMALRQKYDGDQPDWRVARGNINLEYFMSACPVDLFAFRDGFYDIIGNVWQWTETPIDALEGFEPHPAYDDFSTPTFDGKHTLFKGGCWISTGNYAIQASRYAFRRHFFQHAGFRYVEGPELIVSEPNVYETDELVSQYIEFHYGDEYFGVANFPAACARACLDLASSDRKTRALDIGCAAGRASFELAREFDHVDGLDFSARLIQAPTNLQKTGAQRYVIRDEGELVTYKEARLDRLSLLDQADKVAFMQADACNLSDKFTNYDLVFAGNLIDRLYDPARFLDMIHERIRPGGLLALASPYTWLEDFTERSKWLGGFKAATGESRTTFDALNERLGAHFKLVDTRDIPFVIRETRRKFQHTISQFTAWRRR